MSLLGLRVGTLVVLEGLDGTGKSTQMRALERVLNPATTSYAHMPQGFTPFTRMTYEMLESADSRPTSGVARQLAHLACHAETVPQVAKILHSGAVVVDRWWWSNVAYGWYGGDIQGITFETYTALMSSIWAPLTAAVVFLFETPFETDAHNSDLVRSGYHALADEHSNITARVPSGDADTATAYILAELDRRDLLVK